MIAALRRRFILVAMCSLLAVLTAVICTINVTNYQKVLERTDGLLEMLADHDGQFPESIKGQRPEENPKDTFSPETPYETRFFTVNLDKYQNVVQINTRNIAAVTDKQAEMYAADVVEKNKKSGFLSVYRYKMVTEDEGTLLIFVDCRQELDTIRIFALTSIFVSGFGLLAVFLLVVFFSRIVLRPVAESFEKQKQFITDASHEIKTPLAIIDANTEVVEMEYGESQWTQSTKNQIHRLVNLTQQLIILARMDEERTKQQMTDFSLSDAVEESALPFQVMAETKKKSLNLQIKSGITCHGDEKAIRQLIVQLLDNAVKYSSGTGNIELRVLQKGKKCMISVLNDAPELSEGNLDILFERFYRLDSSRNSKTGGSGIGLSVVKAIVEGHKGRISAYCRKGKLEITILL
ncbi:Signal transduction histidine-protein kinase BaeS [uncultured Roseburia sp.]|uniref:histidine kinase n=1 Tax=Brotonthovivens ammoniilytica TaxID=2981725 RepID=A0ABT2TJ51_9FIRM|nr:HAMP domain-containing sensor histidine kinase [Brotonthovivens ammoniilytica]MCU6762186.1 HAMP domain-containing histidine kinase [Brotonthovivens ammoniilytica]SCI58158.1 Signal transduction histidine-protein kinase BaeS [uncultured Roseburia sp.]